MQVILREKIRKLGSLGELVNVKPGYARNFLIFEGNMKRYGWKPYRVEWIIFNEEHNLAGTIDAVFYRKSNRTGENEYLVVDWKTVKDKDVRKQWDWGEKGGYPIHHMDTHKLSQFTVQLSLYAHILRALYNLDVVGIRAVCFTKTTMDEHEPPEIETGEMLRVFGDYNRFVGRVLAWFKEGQCTDNTLPRYPTPIYAADTILNSV